MNNTLLISNTDPYAKSLMPQGLDGFLFCLVYYHVDSKWGLYGRISRGRTVRELIFG